MFHKLISHPSPLTSYHLPLTSKLRQQSYEDIQGHANFRATNLRRESITKPIRLADRLEKVFDTQSKSIGYLVESRKRWICPMVYKLAYLLFRYA